MKRGNSIVIKRVMAFLIDMFIVSIIISMCSFSMNNYSSNSYLEKFSDISNSYISGDISSSDYVNKYTDVIYSVNRANLNSNIISLVVLSGYFILFQFMNGGRTIGKQLMHIRIVNKDMGNVRFYSIVIRAFFINEILSILINIILVLLKRKYLFFVVYGGFSMLFNLLMVISFLMIITRNDCLALHDIISNSCIIED